MADDSAIEVIGALREAGLLRAAARASSDPAAQIITALSDAGLLATPASTGEAAAVGVAHAPAVDVAAPPPAVADPPPAVDDEAYLGNIWRITRALGQVILWSDSPPRWSGMYMVDFPPTNEDWLPLIDLIIAAPRAGLSVDGSVLITKVSDASRRAYLGKLTELRPTFTLR